MVVTDDIAVGMAIGTGLGSGIGYRSRTFQKRDILDHLGLEHADVCANLPDHFSTMTCYMVSVCDWTDLIIPGKFVRVLYSHCTN